MLYMCKCVRVNMSWVIVSIMHRVFMNMHMLCIEVFMDWISQKSSFRFFHQLLQKTQTLGPP